MEADKYNNSVYKNWICDHCYKPYYGLLVSMQEVHIEVFSPLWVDAPEAKKSASTYFRPGAPPEYMTIDVNKMQPMM